MNIHQLRVFLGHDKHTSARRYPTAVLHYSLCTKVLPIVAIVPFMPVNNEDHSAQVTSLSLCVMTGWLAGWLLSCLPAINGIPRRPQSRVPSHL
jgi:hypothetical protein